MRRKCNLTLWGQQRADLNSQSLSPAFPFLACSFSFCCCTFLDFAAEFLGLPNPSVQAEVGEKNVNHMHILYSPKWLVLKGLASKSWLCSWGSRSMAPGLMQHWNALAFTFWLVQEAARQWHWVLSCLLCWEFVFKNMCINQNILINLLSASLEQPTVPCNLIWSSDCESPGWWETVSCGSPVKQQPSLDMWRNFFEKVFPS